MGAGGEFQFVLAAVAGSGVEVSDSEALSAAGCWEGEHSTWSHGGSTRYLWTRRDVERAVAYVVDGQGRPLPDW